MAKSSLVAILDIGSSSITSIIAESGVNNTFNIRGKSEVEYSGFMDGEFLKPNELISVIGHAIESAQLEAKTKITSIFVGVPGEFVSVVVKEHQIKFKGQRRVLAEDIENLYQDAANIKTNGEYLMINRSPIFYRLSDGREFINPIEEKSESLYGKLSYCFADMRFVEMISNVLKHYNIKKIEFYSQNLCEALLLTSEEERSSVVLLADIGYITTNIMLISGEGLLYLKSFSMGGGNVTADISERFKVPFEVAERFKRKVSLTFKLDMDTPYKVEEKGTTYSINGEQLHETVEYRVKEIANMISKCLDMCEEEYSKYAKMYITGGGLLYIRGIKEHLSRSLGTNCESATSGGRIEDEPRLSSCYAVLAMALKSSARGSLFKKIFK